MSIYKDLSKSKRLKSILDMTISSYKNCTIFSSIFSFTLVVNMLQGLGSDRVTVLSIENEDGSRLFFLPMLLIGELTVEFLRGSLEHS